MAKPFVKNIFFGGASLMLKHWTSHADYQLSVSNAISSLNESQLKKFYSYSDTLAKLTSLNLDPIASFLAPLYSSTGRPAIHQPEIIRSFILMLDQSITSLTSWVETLMSDDLLAILIGCTPDQLPPLGSYYDLINRLWLRDKDLELSAIKRTYHFPRNVRPKVKPGKNKKLPNRHPNIIKKIVNRVIEGKTFPFHYEKILQELFSIIAIAPSIDLGLFTDKNITVSGDGTAVHCHSDSLGVKVCECKLNGIFNCKCDRRFPDPDASFGWDSSLESWYYGHTLYMLSTYNSDYSIDLPLHISFLDARRHDSVSGIIALSEFKNLNPNISIKNLCLDSANDNYPTYELCKHWNINPFIDLNENRGRPSTIPDKITIDEDGTPLCHAELRMVNWGFCNDRNSRKWRCPVKCGKVEKCSCQSSCSSSDYGRVIYTKPAWDIRLYTPIPRGTQEYKDVYSTRTCSERINNRILNDYHLHYMRIRSKKRFSFFTMIICINIHLDARVKKAKMDAA